jgi:hypothetical protein
MERGKHVYLEKPLAHEVEEVRRLTDAARESRAASVRTAACCHFDDAGPMSESVLLANIAYRIQGEFEWDAAAMKASRDDATALLRREYRKGWEA